MNDYDGASPTPALLSEILLENSPFGEAVAAFRSGQSISVDGVFGSACALVVAAIAEQSATKKTSPRHSHSDDHCHPLLVVVSSPEQLDILADDLSLFIDPETVVSVFPQLDDWPPNLFVDQVEDEDDQDLSPNASVFALADDSFGQRIRTLKTLANNARKSSITLAIDRTPQIIVASIVSLLQPVPSRQLLDERTQTLEVGSQIDLDQFRRFLVDGGYHHTTAVDLPGEFAVRGYILDLFAPDWEQPFRIEFFGDEIESIRRFDVTTQRSLGNVSKIDLTRMIPREAVGASVLDLLPDDTPIILIEPRELENSSRTCLERLHDSSVKSSSKNTVQLSTVANLMRRILEHPTASLSNLSESLGAGKKESMHVRLPVSSVERFQGNLDTIRRELDRTDANHIILVCPTEAESNRLREMFADIKPTKENRLSFQTGRLSSGFALEHTLQHAFPRSILVLSSSELFGRSEVRRPRRRQLGQTIDSFLDLKPGDYVVHVGHGIALYHGIEMLTKGRQEEENLVLEFADKQFLYIPITKIGFVQKYVAGTRHRPKLAKLGGSLWARHKKAVQEAVFDLAEEMIELQARREGRPGIAFPPDSDWQREFDAAFPFRETDDQLLAIEAVKQDMERPRPMDRLLCGDVGFGKTEVAIRAAFKAVDAGFQVAVLVPTTILAEQHARTFSERMREYPITVAALSRFQNAAEQKQIVENLALGKIDIVIGTHRIVSADISFHNLGLVVIDEEQRFGVHHKERLKTFRESVDVLTMTATPIPRTLHFSLLGIREISNLETPPEDRLAVETRLIRFNDHLIRSAVQRELNRNGQIYFVHNRVQDIDEFASRIQRIVPECRIGVGHAQMPDGELEHVMKSFIEHQFDMLISTTIIESGLDIPNANTMFIDEANHYGLADLHQLRGRVGRSKNQAYCYLVLPRTQTLNSQAAKRLRAIEEYAHLGSGFHLAMRDLEIRGAGNILGTQQSGHIAAVGYEMYCQFLEMAVRTLKRMPPKSVVETELDLPGLSFIPMNYVADHRVKIDLYRRLSRVSTLQEWSDIRDEISDRFGPAPPEVERLIVRSKIRVLAHAYRIRLVRLEAGLVGDSGYVVFVYVSQPWIEKLAEKIRGNGLSIRFTEDRHAYVPMPGGLSRESDEDEILNLIVSILS